ncbi:MAG: tetratricopeptide repeat protein [Tissierellaceae bacterium]|jgi:tetratricopeptide (TPR) repeat protein
METVDKYFKEKTDNLTFIELQDDSFVDLKGYIIRADIPLPILTKELIEGIKGGVFEEEIRISDFVEGIIYTIGTDDNFPYLKEYKEILYAYDDKIEDYIFFTGVRDLQEDRFDDGCIKLRALLALDPNNVDAIFNYGLGIEGLARKFIDLDDEKGNDFLDFSTSLFESILDIDKEYALSYYKLGYHYLYLEQYLKASLTWKKFISKSKDEVLVQEIRNEIDRIDDDVVFETGITYLAYNDYEKALNFFLKLMPKYEDNWNLNFSIAKSYLGLQQDDLAIEYLIKAIELRDDDPDLFNELGIIYYNKGDVIKAIDIFTKGIDSCPKDYKLFYNRGVSYILVEKYKEALKDINIAFELEPSESIKAQKEWLEAIVDED